MLRVLAAELQRRGLEAVLDTAPDGEGAPEREAFQRAFGALYGIEESRTFDAIAAALARARVEPAFSHLEICCAIRATRLLRS